MDASPCRSSGIDVVTHDLSKLLEASFKSVYTHSPNSYCWLQLATAPVHAFHAVSLDKGFPVVGYACGLVDQSRR
jgi:hypothetical protein